MDTTSSVLHILDEVLSLKGRAFDFNASTPLLGSLPELDSMAVVNLLTVIEQRFGLVIEDDEIDGRTFETVGALAQFVQGKLASS